MADKVVKYMPADIAEADQIGSAIERAFADAYDWHMPIMFDSVTGAHEDYREHGPEEGPNPSVFRITIERV